MQKLCLNLYQGAYPSQRVKIFDPRKSNIIVGVIYRHPSMDLTDFNCNYLND